MGEHGSDLLNENANLLLRHGGSAVSHYLQNELHALFETVDPSEVPQLVEELKSVGRPRSSILHRGN